MKFTTERRVLCCALPFKKILYFVNTIFLLIGILFVIFGIITIKNLETISSLLSSMLPLGLIIFGVLIIIISLLGCCGALCENGNLLLLYFFVLMMIITAEGAFALASIRYTSNINTKLSNAWNSSTNATRATIEKTFNCCGFSNYTDRPVLSKNCTGDNSKLDGCGAKLGTFFKENFMYAVILALVLAFVEGIGAALSIFLFCCINYCSVEEEIPVEADTRTLWGDEDEY